MQVGQWDLIRGHGTRERPIPKSHDVSKYVVDLTLMRGNENFHIKWEIFELCNTNAVLVWLVQCHVVSTCWCCGFRFYWDEFLREMGIVVRNRKCFDHYSIIDFVLGLWLSLCIPGRRAGEGKDVGWTKTILVSLILSISVIQWISISLCRGGWVLGTR